MSDRTVRSFDPLIENAACPNRQVSSGVARPIGDREVGLEANSVRKAPPLRGGWEDGDFGTRR
jgi:hypothetical protein